MGGLRGAAGQVGDYLRPLRALFDHYGYHSVLYGHFGQGCIHCRISYDIRDEVGIRTWRRFLDDAADLVVSFGGSLSGERGDGQARAELLPKMYGEEIVQRFREFKAIWDPSDRMNPGKVVNPYPITSNLRLGGSYHPGRLDTHFAYPDDGGSFARAALRRRRQVPALGRRRDVPELHGHSRREGHHARSRPCAVRDDPWRRDRAGLAQRARQGDAGPLSRLQGVQARPVNVDMATYKAEFMAHYYKGRLRPRSAYSMGLIYWWSRLASIAPSVANLALSMPGLSSAIKAAGGIHQQRRMPLYARQTFRSWFRKRGRHAGSRSPVILFPDTFNDFFRPGTGAAAVEVLEHLGYEVRIPPRILCCGRPLYDEGMLTTAKHLLRQIMTTLGPEVADGTPVVGLEPACIATFRDELVNLFPRDDRAQRLARRIFMPGEFLANEEVPLPELKRKATVHFHCNHHAVLEPGDDRRILEGLGLELNVLDSGTSRSTRPHSGPLPGATIPSVAGVDCSLPSITPYAIGSRPSFPSQVAGIILTLPARSPSPASRPCHEYRSRATPAARLERSRLSVQGPGRYESRWVGIRCSRYRVIQPCWAKRGRLILASLVLHRRFAAFL